MNETDAALLNRVRRLHRTLTQRTVLLTHVRSEVDVYAEGLRDLGGELHRLGADLLARVAELDAQPPGDMDPSPRIAALAGRLVTLSQPPYDG
ncbi:hypothetical protein CFN78_13115 [Amycolatopsis antarctica]|uniref:Uncharacterized protein n=1 Tax=Amycolatopsis antarctica TaxID=1854586 RepID=A0A263D289_9PSEU|nr:hypothetical protein [Amycolatopsis antarctica]OZM72582.1 hypothetical protein CFN78_13115 [Amycolatopsis antarctica]